MGTHYCGTARRSGATVGVKTHLQISSGHILLWKSHDKRIWVWVKPNLEINSGHPLLWKSQDKWRQVLREAILGDK